MGTDCRKNGSRESYGAKASPGFGSAHHHAAVVQIKAAPAAPLARRQRRRSALGGPRGARRPPARSARSAKPTRTQPVLPGLVFLAARLPSSTSYRVAGSPYGQRGTISATPTLGPTATHNGSGDGYDRDRGAACRKTSRAHPWPMRSRPTPRPTPKRLNELMETAMNIIR